MRRALLSLLVINTMGVLPTMGAERPNVLWLTSEDHGPHMGCYGDSLARTPHVDALAARGMLFAKVWSCAPVCAPARTAIITGIYPSSSGGLHMRSMVSLPAEMKLFPHYLREAGYYCSNNNKEDYNVRQPIKPWDDSSTKAHWKNRRTGQPFFAVFNSMKSHESQIRTRPHQPITDPAKVRVPAYHPDTPEVRQDWAQYYDKVSEADANAGARLQELEAAGLAADTIIFYFADHGSGMPRNKRWPSNSGLHVPMVVFFPDKWRHLAPKEYQPGGKSNRLVNFVDLAPTVLSIAGLQPPKWMQGHAFAGPYQSDHQPFLFGERGRMDERLDLVRSVTDGRFVYLRNFYPHVSQAQHVAYQFETPTTRVWHDLFMKGQTNDAQSIFWRVPKSPEELYDLQTDPDEVHNLASIPEHRETLERLRRAERDHSATIRDVTLIPEGEFHALSAASTPYQFAHSTSNNPLDAVRSTAELAANLKADAIPELVKLLNDQHASVRYWAAMGLLMRGRDAIVANRESLKRAWHDSSPHVQVVAAQALAQHGTKQDVADSLETLKRLAPPEPNGVFVSISALTAIEALGPQAAVLHEFIRNLPPLQKSTSPDPRYNDYIPRLIKNITASNGPTAGN